jgi:hypothetical protein
MESYLEQYVRIKKSEDDFKKSVLNSIVSILKHDLFIGNMVYYICEDENGDEVPAYCYERDYRNGGPFLPIYDKNNSGEYGWSDFNECCRIFDVIRNKVLANK